MYSRSKYIVGEINGVMSALIFSEVVAHSDLRHAFDVIRSAGFCSISTSGEVSVYGESISLRSKPDPDDVLMIKRAIAHPDTIL